MLSQDARNYQICLLSVFLLLGVATRDWTLRADLIIVLVLTCLVTQGLFSLWLHRDNLGLRSALITALGLSLLLRSSDYRTMAIAAFLAIASKFIFSYQNKHFFNPANFGIIMVLILPTNAWVSPGQWGADWWYLLLFISTGFLIVKKVGRWDTSVSFLLTYTSLLAMRNFWLGWDWQVLEHQLMSGSLLLFAFFMLTDPRSIPNSSLARLIWSVSIAVLTFCLQTIWLIPTAFFWALFCLSPLTIILDQIWSAPVFTWQGNSINWKYQI